MASTQTGDNISIKLEVIHELKQLFMHKVAIAKATNLYDAMCKIKEETAGTKNAFTFEAVQEEVEEERGHYIKAILGIYESKEENLYWFIYNKNGRLQTGVDRYFPKDGDSIIFKYEKYEG